VELPLNKFFSAIKFLVSMYVCSLIGPIFLACVLSGLSHACCNHRTTLKSLL